MTPTEIIATKLFDFDALPCLTDAHENWYVHRPTSNVASVDPNTGHLNVSWCGCEEWPDLADWNDIRRMEDALAEKGLRISYYCALHDEDCDWPEALTATAEQRVASALKAIEEAGL
jgi:hypothetical protein